MQVAQQLMFFTPSIIVIISLESSQPQNLVPIIYTGSKPLLYQKLSLLHYKTAILMLQVEFIEKPYVCISYKFEFLVFCVSVSRLQSSGKPYEWKPYSGWSRRGCDWGIWCCHEAQQTTKSSNWDQWPPTCGQQQVSLFNYYTSFPDYLV